ncbi:uncharacterized protein LOC136076769 isoform X1 [Hydra vulgaris]|uniref:Uncharacterized protein LOC136076769 isoform X1 n=1 Tax=Hydra vulgaris TaxID=6087 RepID=A0ABM4BBI3_HYDVU
MSFVIVEFLNGKIKEVEVIAKSWMKNDGKCFWPPFKSSAVIRKAVTTLQAPTSDWKIYPARILYTTDFYEEARSCLEKAADTSNIETDTEEKKGTKRKRMTAMKFCESDEDNVVGDEELYGRHYFDSSNSQRTSNMISNIADVFKSISTPHLHSEIASFSVADNNIDFSKETNLSQGKMMLSSNMLVENGFKNCVLNKEDSRETHLSCQDFQKVALSWMAKIDKKIDKLFLQQSTSTVSASSLSTEPIFERCLTKSDVGLLEEKVKASNVFKSRVMNSLSRCGGNTPYKSAFAIGKLLMSEDAGACFNVSGGSLKISFKTYTLYHMIVDAITRQHHDAKICECHSGISEFLRQ